jgi:hypothetical protein
MPRKILTHFYNNALEDSIKKFRDPRLTCGNGLEKLPVLYAVQKQCQKKNEPGQPARP